MSRSVRSLPVFLFDISGLVFAWVGGFLLRFNFDIPPNFMPAFWSGLVLLWPLHALACHQAGLYRESWLFASLPDLKRVLRAVAMSSAAVLLFYVFFRYYNQTIPRLLLAVYPMLLLLYMGGGRAAYRIWSEHRLYGGPASAGKPVVIAGAGEGAAMLVRALERSAEWRVVGIVDDDPDRWGREISGCTVLGGLESLPDVLKTVGASDVILAMPSSLGEARGRVTDLSLAAGAHVFTVPGLDDVMAGRTAISWIRPIEIEDLLKHEPVSIDSSQIAAILAGKTVLVTGAGGSVGSELCRQVARFAPARLILFDQSELALQTLEHWLALHLPGVQRVVLAGDVKDGERLAEVFACWQPEVVLHAAAYKLAALMEVGNAWQAVRNNVLGTLRVGECAGRFGVERFLLISTHKVVHPASVASATQRLAEMVCTALHRQGVGTRFEIVRLGNVLGAAGGLIPRLQGQIARGGPVTVTHPEMARRFIPLPEAAQLVLQAGAIGQGGEIYIVEMGEPVKIVDLVRRMIRLGGFSEERVRIEFTGLRPGEKLLEENPADAGPMRPTAHQRLSLAPDTAVDDDFLPELRRWLEGGIQSDAQARDVLVRWLPDYQPAVS